MLVVMGERRSEPDPGAWKIGAYYRNVVRVRISTLWDLRCSPFRVETGTVWFCNRVFSKLETPLYFSPYWLNYIELLADDPRPEAAGGKLIHLNCMVSSCVGHTRGFSEIDSPLDLLALSGDGLLPIVGDDHWV